MEKSDLLNISLAFSNIFLCPFRHFLNDQTLTVLDKIAKSEKIIGVTDSFSLSLLSLLVRLLQPKKILQLGTFSGYTAIILAGILQANYRAGRLFTVEIYSEYHKFAHEHALEAGLGKFIDFIDGSSTDLAVVEKIKKNGPYELIYIDSSHAYLDTFKELCLYVEDKSIVSNSSIVFFHDAAREAEQYDPTNSGGVRRALEEWFVSNSKDFYLLILEPPLWPNACGVGLIARKNTPSHGMEKESA
jgi:predicted O-methyltransferase YrrM